MSTSIHVNRHIVQSVVVEHHPDLGDLPTLTITEGDERAVTNTSLTMGSEVWQQVADQLAALGIVAREPVVSS